MAEVHVGDTPQFIFEIVDQAGVIVILAVEDTLEVKFQKPDETVFKRTAALLTDGQDGKMAYTAVPTDFDQDGGWIAQAEVDIVTGPPPGEWNAERVFFNVLPVLVVTP